MTISPSLLSAAIQPAVVAQVLAYIDPGTTTSLFALLTPLLAILGMFLGFLLWPFRRVLGALFGRKGASAEPAAQDAPQPDPAETPAADEGALTKSE